MKKSLYICLTLLSFFSGIKSQVAINNTGAPPDPSAMLDVQSTNKGFYPPRMTWSQIKAIQSPGPGMVVYDTDFGKLRIYNGSKWNAVETDTPYDQPAGTFKSFPILSELQLETISDLTIDPVSKNIYFIGSITDGVYGQAVSGTSDALLVAYSESGQRLWARTMGCSGDDIGYSVVVGADGSIYSAIASVGPVDGQPYIAGFDVSLIKFSKEGDKLWTRSFGTNLNEKGLFMATDPAGNIYVSGYTESSFAGYTNTGGADLFIAKYDPSGNQVWLREAGGNANVFIEDIFINSTGIYCTGSTGGDLDGQQFKGGSTDGFVMKFDFTGTKLFTRIFGSSVNEFGIGLVTDATGNFFITGNTDGNLNGVTHVGQNADAFLVKYDPFGNVLWTKLYGQGLGFFGGKIQIAANGDLYTIGQTISFPGYPEFNGSAIYLRKLDKDGNTIWTKFAGSDYWEKASIFSNIVDDCFYILGSFGGNFCTIGNNRITSTFGYNTVESFLWKYAE